MLKVFVDSSVLFTMCNSAKSAAREIMRLALQGQVQLLTSAYALDETETQLTTKAPHSLANFRYLKSRSFWVIVDATHKEAELAQVATSDIYDTPIVAAAKKAKVDALVTFDRKHLIRQSVADYIGAVVTTPDQILKRIRAEKH